MKLKLALPSLSILLLTSCGEMLHDRMLVENRYLSELHLSSLDTTVPLKPERITSELENLFATHKFPQMADHLLKEYQRLYTEADLEKRAFIAYQLSSAPENLPCVPDASLSLPFMSLYDGYELPVTLKMPENPKGKIPSLFVFLGAPEEFPLENIDSSAWMIFIPSRPALNYELLAEGDFLKAFSDFLEIYPHLNQSTKILVGMGKSSSPALEFANNYQNIFDGVAWSQKATGFEYKNLDRFPLAYYHTKDAPVSVFEGKQLIERFHERGHTSALYAGSLGEALNFLALQKTDHSKPYVFEDYQYAHPTPWLEVLHKNSEEDAASIAYDIKDKTLEILTDNISHIAIHPKLIPTDPEISSISFLGKSYLYQENKEEIILGAEEEVVKSFPLKSEAPGSLMNFFRREPTWIVYQDKGASDELLDIIYQSAYAAAHMKFLGLPDNSGSLPMLALSEYTPQSFEKDHRILYWGLESSLDKLMEEENYHPLYLDQGSIYVKGKHITSIPSSIDKWAYFLATPYPHDFGPKLVGAFIAEDKEGFVTLQKELLKSTALYLPTDLALMGKTLDQGYEELGHYTYGGFWDTSSQSAFLFHNPFQDQSKWDEMISKYLLKDSNASGLLSEPFFYRYQELPESFSKASFKEMIDDRSFSLVNFQGWEGATLLVELLKLYPEAMQYGMEHLSESTKLPSDFYLSIMVDNNLLEKLPEMFLRRLNYTPLPYRLQEWLTQGLEEEIDFFNQYIYETALEQNKDNSHG